MEYSITIAGLTRRLPLCPISPTRSIGAFVMSGDVELTVAAAGALLAAAPAFDCLLTAEAKGIPLAYEMARQSGRPYFVARKGAKLYMPDPFEIEVRSITTEKIQHLCLGADDAAALRGRRVLIVDDVISTGESLAALEALAAKAGGIVAGRMAVLAEGDAKRRADIRFLAPLPLFTPDGTPVE